MTAWTVVLFAGAGGSGAETAAPAPITNVDIALIANILGSIVLFGGAAVLALGWAFRNGQFENFDQGSKSIFGPDEPIGEPTDAFPGAPAEHEPGAAPRGRTDEPTGAFRQW